MPAAKSPAVAVLRALAFAAVAIAATGARANDPGIERGLTAAEIVDRNVAARGGLDAWRNIRTMVWSGHMESADSAMLGMPFVLVQQRPNKTRFELDTFGHKTLRIFDGRQGWTARASHDGGMDVRPYSAREASFAAEAEGIDGPLIDYRAKGITVELEGTDEVEGHKAYRLAVRQPSGDRHHVWIDAATFLDLKYDRTSYSAAGVPGTVSVVPRNYRTIEGLQMPMMLEIGAGSARVPDRMVIERVSLNPPLGERTFAKPGNTSRHAMAIVDIKPPEVSRQPAAPQPGQPASGAKPGGD